VDDGDDVGELGFEDGVEVLGGGDGGETVAERTSVSESVRRGGGGGETEGGVGGKGEWGNEGVKGWECKARGDRGLL